MDYGNELIERMVKFVKRCNELTNLNDDFSPFITHADLDDEHWLAGEAYTIAAVIKQIEGDE